MYEIPGAQQLLKKNLLYYRNMLYVRQYNAKHQVWDLIPWRAAFQSYFRIILFIITCTVLVRISVTLNIMIIAPTLECNFKLWALEVRQLPICKKLMINHILTVQQQQTLISKALKIQPDKCIDGSEFGCKYYFMKMEGINFTNYFL